MWLDVGARAELAAAAGPGSTRRRTSTCSYNSVDRIFGRPHGQRKHGECGRPRSGPSPLLASVCPVCPVCPVRADLPVRKSRVRRAEAHRRGRRSASKENGARQHRSSVLKPLPSLITSAALKHLPRPGAPSAASYYIRRREIEGPLYASVDIRQDRVRNQKRDCERDRERDRARTAGGAGGGARAIDTQYEGIRPMSDGTRLTVKPYDSRALWVPDSSLVFRYAVVCRVKTEGSQNVQRRVTRTHFIPRIAAQRTGRGTRRTSSSVRASIRYVHSGLVRTTST
ncbi:hypothetical protein EVAR_65643_1 [Eumeta japonica]|uniref:Uncharacterized protein n=1 Tax=Eumeta variegata TaxID=151549 RepID=A0A4C1ZAB3_EUMVA|nr:hypothetical protein EVAR_65643_1 [Eumeta japonica]